MKALIIAAGKGSRLEERGGPKSLVPVLGIPLIERVIRSAIAGGVDEFCVVSGYNGAPVRDFLDRLARRCKTRIAHVVNEEWELDNGVSVLKAKEQAGESFLLLMADHLFDPAIVRELIGRPPQDGEVTLAVDANTANPLVDIEDVTRVRREEGKVCQIGKGLADFDGYDTGIYLCKPALFDALKHSVANGGDTSLSAGVRHLAAAGKVNALEVGGRFWVDVDDPKALCRAEHVLLAALRHKPTDGLISRYLNRPLSARISRHLAKLPLTPNHISVLSFLGSLLAAALLAAGGYPALALGGVVAQFASILDGCDGELARLRYQQSDYGRWLDAVLDRYADAFLLFGLLWHVQHAGGGGALGLFVGFMAIIGSLVLSYTADKYDGLLRARAAKDGFLRVGRDLRVFLVFIAAVLGQPFAGLAVIAAWMNGEVIRRLIMCRGQL